MRVVFRLRGVSWGDMETNVKIYSTIGGRAIRRVISVNIFSFESELFNIFNDILQLNADQH